MKRILVAFEPHTAFSRGKLAGIRDFANECGDWQILLDLGNGDRLIRRSGIDGMLGPSGGAVVGLARDAGIPQVCPFTGGEKSDLPTVRVDHRRAAEIALDHFLACGIRSLASFPDRRPVSRSSILRERALVDLAGQRGLSVACFHDPPGKWALDHQIASLVGFLTDLSKPLGVFCSDDEHGWRVLEAARLAGIDVPDQVAVLGCQNDPVLCEFSDPPLSSIVFDQYGAGYEAAAMLDRLIRGHPLDSRTRLIPPIGVIARRSTDRLAINDELVIAAVRYIRDRVDEPISIDDVVGHIGLSKSALTRRFKNSLDRTIQQEIRRSRLRQAEHLLMTTDLGLADIAARCAYTNASQLSRDFHQHAGQTAGAFRKAHRRKNRRHTGWDDR